MSSLIAFLTLFIFVLPASAQTTEGNSFFIAFPKSSFRDEELSIFITTQHRERVFVLVRSLKQYHTLGSVRQGTTLVVNPPSRMEVLGGSDYDKGLWIRTYNSHQRISVSVMKHARSSSLSGTYLALPNITYPGLHTYEYYVTSYYWNNRVPTNYSSTVVLVGTQPNTTVTITPSQQIALPPHFISESYPQGSLNAGDSYTAVLQPMETFHIESLHDLTGTKIVSDKPLTVIGSHECTDIPVGVMFCDYISEQIPPTVTWGRHFLLTSLHSRRTGERYKVIGMKSSTIVKVKCVLEGQSSPELGHMMLALNASGESREFELGRDRLCSVLSNKPILLVQFSVGYSLDQVGDPFMLMVPPVSQYSNNFTVYAPRRYYNHLSITVPLEFFNSSQILVNETTVSDWSPVYCADSMICGYGKRLSVPPGTHRIRHQDPGAGLMVYAYGFEYHDGYGQIAGMMLKKIANVCQHGEVRLDPTFSDDFSGVVEVCLDGVWTSVCGDGWSPVEASVACRQLGFSQGLFVESNSTRWPTVASDLRCLQFNRRLVECVHSWDLANGQPAGIRCFPYFDISVEIVSPTEVLHPALSQVTLVCLSTPNSTLDHDLSVQLTWTKDDSSPLQNSTHHTITRQSLSIHNNTSGRAVLRYESRLVINSVKPSDSGTYRCSAAVVVVPTLRLLSGLHTSRFNISVVETIRVSVLIQLRLHGVGRCSDWLLQYESPQQKADELSSAVLEHLQTSCQNCGDIAADLISEAAFRCFNRAANEITFRARLWAPHHRASLSLLTEQLRRWVEQGPSLRIGGVLLRVDPGCEVVVDSLNTPECSGETTITTTTFTTTTTSTTTSTTSAATPAHQAPTSPPAPLTSSDEAPTFTASNSQRPASDKPTSFPRTSSTVATTVHSSDIKPGSTTSDNKFIIGQDSNTADSSGIYFSTASIMDLGDTSDTMMYVILGTAAFIITISITSVACVAVIISCLKYKKSTQANMNSATPPFQLTNYDNPVVESTQGKSDLTKDSPPNYFGLSDIPL